MPPPRRLRSTILDRLGRRSALTGVLIRCNGRQRKFSPRRFRCACSGYSGRYGFRSGWRAPAQQMRDAFRFRIRGTTRKWGTRLPLAFSVLGLFFGGSITGLISQIPCDLAYACTKLLTLVALSRLCPSSSARLALAMVTAIRNASSRVSIFAADRRPASSSKEIYASVWLLASFTMKQAGRSSIDQGGGKRRLVVLAPFHPLWSLLNLRLAPFE